MSSPTPPPSPPSEEPSRDPSPEDDPKRDQAERAQADFERTVAEIQSLTSTYLSTIDITVRSAIQKRLKVLGVDIGGGSGSR